MFHKYYGTSPDNEVYTNYRIKLEQITWLNKWLAGEDIFKDAPVAKKVKLTPEQIAEFTQKIKSITPVKKPGVK